MEKRLNLSLGGPFLATDQNGRPLTGLSRRAQALLAFLVCQPSLRAERGLVADLLWSDRSEEQARASLRQELSVLRRALPEGVLETERQVVWLDASRLTAAGTEGGEDFLQGFDLASEGFEDWLRDMRQRDEPPAADRLTLPKGRPTLAILPFDELGAAEADMFADGVVEEVTGALSRIHDFHVIARQSSFALRGQSLAIPEIAARLGADYLVEGSVRRSGERVRIAVQLVAGGDGRLLWSERFDDRLDDLFALQDRIAARVAGQVSPSLRQAEIDRARTTPPQNRGAYDLTLTAFPLFWAHRKEDNSRALALFDAALERDPGYAPALGMKAWCHAQNCCYIWTGDPAAERRRALAAADIAAEAAGNHAPTLVAIGAAISLTSLERERARSFITRALELDPNNAWGWLRSGWLNSLNNYPDQALADFDRAEALSPLDPFRFNILFGRANSLAEQGEHLAAARLVERGLNMAPGVTWAYRMLAAYYTMAGLTAEADRAIGTFLAHYPGITIRKMRDSMPPSIFETQPAYIEGIRRAGVPEE